MNLLNWEEYNDEDQFLEDFGNPPEKPPTAEQVRALQVRLGLLAKSPLTSRVVGLQMRGNWHQGVLGHDLSA